MGTNGKAEPIQRVVAIGASAGGIQATLSILNALPADFPAPILIVIHTSSESPGLLPAILQRNSKIRVLGAEDNLPLAPGTAYVACPGKHMQVHKGLIQVTNGPYENRNRPAVDPTFRSVALEYGPGAIGVVLTGYLDDGTAGVASIKRHGGKAIAQDPDDAEVPSMPRSAIAYVQMDAVAPLVRIPELLQSFVKQPLAARPRIVKEERSMPHDPASPSVYTCPECHGTLWEVQDGDMLRFECRVGHAYSQESMVEDQNESTERAIWAALRALEEAAQLSRRLVKRSTEMGHHLVVERYRQRAQTAEQHIQVLRRILGHVEPDVMDTQIGSKTSGI